ncbi:hypothetical protein T440DRAFT_450582 [Plenodomus tracheiphilus IPT5]|uniref:Uncharacterized protein n=1 Tax=Plenodomus tracheiphilus IPT5 TaxID=1408161 RepID=A0A6A7B5H8_9PLEO|nr:hypothetical protein T440DRAFT_450582 [Plenodomus tracheiphilus IPT5]
MSHAERKGYVLERPPSAPDEEDFKMISDIDNEEMDANDPDGEDERREDNGFGNEHARSSTQNGRRCSHAKDRPHLTAHQHDPASNHEAHNSSHQANHYTEDTQFTLPVHHTEPLITLSNILSPTLRGPSCNPEPFSESISPTYPPSEYSDPSEPPVSSKHQALPAAYHRVLPNIRRVIAQHGNQARVEYYPQWISRVWLKNNTPAAIWEEWKGMKEDQDSVLTYAPLVGRGHTSLTRASMSTSLSNLGKKGKGKQIKGDWSDNDADEDNKKRVPRPWKVLRSEVCSDNDGIPYLTAMLSEIITRATQELSNRKIHHVLSSPVDFVPGSKRRAAQLMGRDEQNLEVNTFLRYLAKLSARERRKFEGVKVRWMGQIDPRVTTIKGRTHNVSAVAYTAPVSEGWKNPLEEINASDYALDSDEHSPSSSSITNEDQDDDDDIPQRTHYENLLHHKSLLLPLLHACPWLLTPTSHFTSLCWLLLPRRNLTHTFRSLGIGLASDWHTYTRELYLCRYSEVVGDRRGWHDLMETSLWLNRWFKELRIGEEGVRDVWETDSEADSEEEDGKYVSVGGMGRQVGEDEDKGKENGANTMPRGIKRAASEMEDTDAKVADRSRRISLSNTENDDNDNDNDEDYTDTQELFTSTEDEQDPPALTHHHHHHSKKPTPSHQTPTSRTTPHPHLPRKSASSKAPRRANTIDPDAISPGKKTKATVDKARRVAREKRNNLATTAVQREDAERDAALKQVVENFWVDWEARRARGAGSGGGEEEY